MSVPRELSATALSLPVLFVLRDLLARIRLMQFIPLVNQELTQMQAKLLATCVQRALNARGLISVLKFRAPLVNTLEVVRAIAQSVLLVTNVILLVPSYNLVWGALTQLLEAVYVKAALRVAIAPILMMTMCMNAFQARIVLVIKRAALLVRLGMNVHPRRMLSKILVHLAHFLLASSHHVQCVQRDLLVHPRRLVL